MKIYRRSCSVVGEHLREPETVCIICGSYSELIVFKGRKVCRQCISGIK